MLKNLLVLRPFFALSDTAFVKTYSSSKNLTNYLIQLVTPFIEPLECYRMLKMSTGTQLLEPT
jgi:hypothetical protein